MDLTDDERAFVLLGLFELRITHLEDEQRCTEIDALAAKLGGDLSAMLFGADVTNGWGARNSVPGRPVVGHAVLQVLLELHRRLRAPGFAEHRAVYPHEAPGRGNLRAEVLRICEGEVASAALEDG